jgi:hypothetical protein
LRKKYNLWANLICTYLDEEKKQRFKESWDGPHDPNDPDSKECEVVNFRYSFGSEHGWVRR